MTSIDADGSHECGRVVTNEIQKIRESIERGLAPATMSPGGPTIALSPCGKYRLEIEEYAAADGADYAIAVVRRVANGDEVATVKRNDSRCFYAWVSRDGHDYLLFPEDLEGQTVIDLTTGDVAGFSSPDDEFIWCEYYPSPDRTKLAILGCYWACPYQVTVYDFHDPLNLPLPKLAEFVLPENDARFAGWVNQTTFHVQSKDGSVRAFEFPVFAPDTTDI
jgi:hypothetical protein